MMLKLNFSSALALAVMISATGASAVQAITVVSDFSEISTIPVDTDSIILPDNMTLTLKVTGTDFVGLRGTRVMVGGGFPDYSLEPRITFELDRSISNLRLKVYGMDRGLEYLSDFSVAPTRVEANYQLNDGLVSSLMDRGAMGNLFWENINAKSISFTFNRSDWSRGIFFDEFQIEAQSLENLEANAVPEPLTILGVGTAASFGAFFKKKVSQNKSRKSSKVG